jgi:two-component system nitrogen regulation sensor histidine kinase GlnL
VLEALPQPVLVIDAKERIRFANAAAEQFFQVGAASLLDRPLAGFLGVDSPLLRLVAQARRGNHSVAEHDAMIDLPRLGERLVSVDAAPMGQDGGGEEGGGEEGADGSDSVVMTLRERSIARQIDRRLTHRGAARSLGAMAAMLAHEVKNPLSGIRGAAQLLGESAGEEDRELTHIILGEADRILALVERMDMFAEGAPLARWAINIHQVLSYVRRVAESGFARHLRFVERYDPSLPPVLGQWDLLVQIFLNLVKNAAEAVPAEGGESVLETRYRHGLRLALPGSGKAGGRVDLPICVVVRDNGSGIPEDLRAHLFEPFVTSKSGGRGLGLSLVAKMVSDLGGSIEVESRPGRTLAQVLLPMAPADEEGADEEGAAKAQGGAP